METKNLTFSRLRGVILIDWYCMCKKSDESIDHLYCIVRLLDCFGMIIPWIGASVGNASHFGGAFSQFGNSRRSSTNKSSVEDDHYLYYVMLMERAEQLYIQRQETLYRGTPIFFLPVFFFYGL